MLHDRSYVTHRFQYKYLIYTYITFKTATHEKLFISLLDVKKIRFFEAYQ